MNFVENEKATGVALRTAARAGDIEKVSKFVSTARDKGDDCLHALLDSRDEQSGNTALHFSCANGHIDVVRFLLRCSASTNTRNASGSTALHYAALTGQLEAVEALLKGGASPVIENNFRRTALDDAQSARQAEVVDFLIRFVESNASPQDIEDDESDKGS